MLGRLTASQIAAASFASFFPPLPSILYGETWLAAIIFALKPRLISSLAQKCEPEQASISTTQPGSNSAEHQGRNFSRDNDLLNTTFPKASTPHTCRTFFAKSTPTRVIFFMEPPVKCFIWLYNTSHLGTLTLSMPIGESLHIWI